MSGTLYVVGTPIGNLGDMSPRGVSALETADFIAAEDTRVTVKLLNHFGIKKEMLSYYEHNKSTKGNLIIKRLLEGESCALVSDAGMPAISDPGEDLVRLCINEGIEVIPLPGACAFTTALIASGMPTGRFSFEGFLTTNKRNRKIHLTEVKDDTRTLIFYEAPHKLTYTLKDMLDVLGDREIVLARELTKKFEEFYRTTISEALTHYEATPPKGEFVLIIKGADKKELEETRKSTLPPPEDLIREYFKKGLRGKELTGYVAEVLGLPKREVYDIYLKIKDTL